MTVPVTLQLAVKALDRHRLRSVLTLLGITIGVAVVIVMVAVGSGARHTIEEHVRAAGVNMIQVTAGNYSRGDQDPGSGEADDTSGGAGVSDGGGAGARHVQPRGDSAGWAGMAISPRVPGRGAATTLSIADVEAIGRQISGVRYRAAGISETAVLVAGSNRVLGRVQGTDVDYPEMRALTLREGRFFRGREVTGREAVAVLSAQAAIKLFGNRRVLGETLAIRRKPFIVIGVAMGSSAAGKSNGLDDVFMPFTAAQDLLGITHLQHVAISVASAGESTRVARDVTRLLRARHSLGPNDADDFTVRTQASAAVNGKNVDPLFARAVAGSVVNLDQVTMADIAASLERSSRTMTALLASVAGVSLLVGGVGIMNIMLVSVTERTREIGLRMAVGARGRDVLVQFLTEAVTLSVIGGLIGIGVGIGASGSVGWLLRWSTVISPASVVVSVGVAAAVGILFGFYPARQASRLDPIEALRFE